MGNSSSRRQRKEASADPGGTQHQTDEEKKEGTLLSETVFEESPWLTPEERQRLIEVWEQLIKQSTWLTTVERQLILEVWRQGIKESRWLTPEERQLILEVLRELVQLWEQVIKQNRWLTPEECQLILEERQRILEASRKLLQQSRWLKPEERQRLIEDYQRLLEVLRHRTEQLGWRRRATLAYQNALEAGRVQVFRAQVMLIGQDRAGKTSLKKSLLGLPFDPDERSTDGVEVDPSSFEIEVEQVQNWKRIYEKPGMSLFGNGLLKIMGEGIRKSNPVSRWKRKEKMTEQDKVGSLEGQLIKRTESPSSPSLSPSPSPSPSPPPPSSSASSSFVIRADTFRLIIVNPSLGIHPTLKCVKGQTQQ